ncbi:O-antigen ligase family protein, partial [Klebsiella pneumoniae]|uniref:O-antigen ligase family protein n=1 Tax=Klebsiella pneumoniae TaxID=573 RepID=UPI0015F826C2
VFGLVYLLTKRQWRFRTKLAFVAGLVVIMAVVAALAWNSKESRWKNVVSDVSRYEQHDRDTSVGIRIQLWQASWLMFRESPLVGVGVPNFRPELVKLQKQGIVSELVPPHP